MHKDLNYYKNLDLKYQKEGYMMTSLTEDFAFKSIFGKNPNILKKMLISVLRLDLDPNLTKIDLLNVELPKDIKKEYKKSVDILVFLSPNHTISVEVNRSKFDDVKRRNLMYFAKIYSLSLNTGEKHTSLKDKNYYQLNINTEKSDFGEDTWYIRSSNTGKIAIDEIVFFIENIEFYYNLYYTEHEELTNDKLWLVLVASKNFKQLYTIASKLMKKEEMKKFMDDAERINYDIYKLTDEELKALDEIQEYDTRQNALREGREEGQKNEKIATAKKMLDKKMSLDDIIEITGLTKKEVEEIANN